MSIAALIVIALRLVIPISIFRWRKSGAVVAMILDGLDVVLVDVIAKALGEQGGFGDFYQPMDKWLDMYYLTFEVIVSLRWSNTLARNTSVFLFVYRLLGLIIFEITGVRKVLFIFPNMFENFFLYYIIADRFVPRIVPRTYRQLALVLALLYIPKFGQEWVLHFQELKPWEWFKGAVLGIS